MLDPLLRLLGAAPGQKGAFARVHATARKGTRPNTDPRPRRRRGFSPALENLEERTLLSGAQPGVYALTPLVGPSAPLPASLPGGLSPAQVRHAYGFDQITFSNGTVQGDGSGQTIAIIDAYDQPNIASNLATFDSTYGLPAPPSFLKVNESGGTTYPTASTSWGLEISLDVEWAHAIAPGAKILLVEANSNSWSDLFTAVNYARNQPGVAAVSMSFGGSEWSGMTSFDSYFQTPSGHSGVTFVASSGDSGTSGAPNYPSVSPNVLAVGGTQLSVDSSGNYLGETGWSGSGGGVSAYYSQPGYQNGVVTQSTARRTVPDVAYDGSSGSPFAIYDTSGYGGWVQVYGTSAGAPQWAALVAIADQGRALAGKAALDGASQALPALYQLPAADFHDITSGSNGGFSAGPGYDLVTGRGTPYANLVVAGLVGSTSSSGQGPTVVTQASATPSTVTGTTTGLTVSATDPAGATKLTYTWSVTAEPAGAAAPSFSANGTNAAQNSTATFHKAGSYTFQVTITDPSGLTATSSVSVTVNPTFTRVSVTPGSASLADGGTQQFTASALDQFGNAMATQPSWAWSLGSGGMGTVSSTGLYTAPGTGSGTVTIQGSGGGLMGTASVTIGSAPAAPSNLTARLVSSRQVSLTWTDNSNNETGFVIQRSMNGGAWTQIAVVGANVTTYTDTTVSKHKTYSYRVYAYNSTGNSGYSNVTSGLTPSVGTLALGAAPAGQTDAGVASALVTLGGSAKPAARETPAPFQGGAVTVGQPRFAGQALVSHAAMTGDLGASHAAPAAGDALGLLRGTEVSEDLGATAP
jgi:subtilase family serine protease